jgi:hypothetical protein
MFALRFAFAALAMLTLGNVPANAQSYSPPMIRDMATYQAYVRLAGESLEGICRPYDPPPADWFSKHIRYGICGSETVAQNHGSTLHHLNLTPDSDPPVILSKQLTDGNKSSAADPSQAFEFQCRDKGAGILACESHNWIHQRSNLRVDVCAAFVSLGTVEANVFYRGSPRLTMYYMVGYSHTWSPTECVEGKNLTIVEVLAAHVRARTVAAK